MRLVKLWARHHGVNDSTNGTLNSFALTLLVGSCSGGVQLKGEGAGSSCGLGSVLGCRACGPAGGPVPPRHNCTVYLHTCIPPPPRPQVVFHLQTRSPAVLPPLCELFGMGPGEERPMQEQRFPDFRLLTVGGIGGSGWCEGRLRELTSCRVMVRI